MSMRNNTQPNAAPENNMRELINLIDNLVGDVHDDVESSAMSMSNNMQPIATPENNVQELNLIDNFVGDVHDDVEVHALTFKLIKQNTDVDTQLKLGPSRHPVDTQLKLSPARHPVENTDVSESVESVDTQLSFSVHQDFQLPVEVAATTEAGDGAIPIPRKKRKISGDEGSSKGNERLMEDDIDTHAKTVSLEDLLMSPKSDDDLVEECHITPTAAPEKVGENGQMADAPEIGGLHKSTRPRKPNPRLKGYELYDPKKGYYLNE